jgi:hypothetical protein
MYIYFSAQQAHVVTTHLLVLIYTFWGEKRLIVMNIKDI